MVHLAPGTKSARHALSSIAKITRPKTNLVLPRPRLFSLLEAGRSAPLIWVSGPAGSGKTTLVASWLEAKEIPSLWYRLDERDSDVATFFYYLGPAAKKAAGRRRVSLPLLTVEYAKSIPVFTKRYFERLCLAVPSPFVIVLDNYHDVAPDSAFHEVLRDAVSVLPEGVAIAVVSRTAPPTSVSSLQCYTKLAHVGWDELRFDSRETRALVRQYMQPAGRELVNQLHRTTVGWVAGLVLLIQWMRGRRGVALDFGERAPEGLLDYFATELFEKTDPDTRQFLLKSSFLPHLETGAVAELTGCRSAGSLLSGLSRSHFFTEQRSSSHTVYEYHPLFRAFLQSRARETFSHEECVALMRQAAELMERAGHDEQAAALYQQSGEWGSFIRLILKKAPSMIAQGRHQALQGWLRSLPESTLESTPWLLYWLGVCRMPFDLGEGREHFEKAFALLTKADDGPGVLLAWAGVVQSINLELGNLRKLDSWIEMIGDLRTRYRFAPVPPPIDAQVKAHGFMAIGLRQPDHSDFDDWREEALTLIESKAEYSLRMITCFYVLSHSIWVGDWATARRALALIRGSATGREEATPLADIMGRMAESWAAWLMGSPRSCFKIMTEGLARSKETGVHMWDYLLMTNGVAGALCSGDLATSRAILDKMAMALDRVRLLDKFYYHHESSWHHWLAKDVATSLGHQRQALALAESIGLAYAEAQSHFAMAHLMRAIGERDEAREHVEKGRSNGRQLGSRIVEYMFLLADAEFALEDGDEEAGLAHLRRAFALGKAQGYTFFSWWHPSLMLTLCTRALEAGIETEYVRSLIRTCELTPVEPPVAIETWPYPLCISTLGGFAVTKYGETPRAAARIQKKPLELLKALIAFGGRKVRVDRLVDVLWPDADGDLAHASFEMALLRLRRFIAHDGAIRLDGGLLSLDDRCCWVDRWALDEARDYQDPRKIERALRLYRGDFLPDDDRPWIEAAREQLRETFNRLSVKVAEPPLRGRGSG